MNDTLQFFGLSALILYALYTTIVVICMNTLTIKNWVKCIGLSFLTGLTVVVIAVSVME